MEVARLGVKLELQLPPDTTATATPDPSPTCNLHHSSQQWWIFNSMSGARDRTCVLMELARFISTEPQWELPIQLFLSLFFFFFFSFVFCLFRATQARGQIRAVAARLYHRLYHSHSNTESEPPLRPYTTAHGNTGSLTHGARPGIEPMPSWILVGLVNH